MQKAIQSDSGLYTCTPSTANAASVRVHILSGKSGSGEEPGGWGKDSQRGTGEQTVNSFHLVARRTSGGDASRVVDETEQSRSADYPLLLLGHSHLPEL